MRVLFLAVPGELGVPLRLKNVCESRQTVRASIGIIGLISYGANLRALTMRNLYGPSGEPETGAGAAGSRQRSIS